MRKPWLEVAESEIGIKERSGSNHHPRILEYHKVGASSLSAQTDEVPWCASFVGWVLNEVGIKGTNMANARSYLKWGEECEFKVGAVVVYWRGSKNGWKGHVGFISGHTPTGQLIKTLGGNQSNKVSIARYRKDRVLGYRWHPAFNEMLVSFPKLPIDKQNKLMRTELDLLYRERFRRLRDDQRGVNEETFVELLMEKFN